MNPMIKVIDGETNVDTEREMTDEEYAELLSWQIPDEPTQP
jgi:hypothetical protein